MLLSSNTLKDDCFVFLSTEVGYTVEWPPLPQGLDWQWQVPRKGVDFHFVPFHEDLYEIVIKVRTRDCRCPMP